MAEKAYYKVLKITDYRNFLIGRFFGVMGIQIQAVVVGWQIYEITKDPLSLGLIGLCEIIPSFGISLFAGAIADRVSRKKIILIAFTILSFCSASLLICSLNMIPVLRGNTIAIYGIIFVSGLARGFLGASIPSFMAQLVPKEFYPNTSALTGTAWQAAAVTGPFLGGILFRFQGAELAYSVDLGLMICCLFFFSLIGSKPIPLQTNKETFISSLTGGFKFVFKNPVLLSAMSLDMFAVLFGGAVALLPIFASDILKEGPEGLGLLRASPSVGAAIMGLYLTYNPPRKNAGKILLVSVAGFGLAMLLFGLSKNFYLSLVILAFSGCFDCVSVIIRSTIVQTFTPDNMRGRVASVSSIFIGSSNELGAFESGVTAKLMGVVPSVIFGACMTLGVVVTTGTLSKSLRDLDFE
ncbi:MAG: MFS transporter [Leptospiraceae bacterium]|nr:MFS transporter [Leptospiraceae bacterium]